MNRIILIIILVVAVIAISFSVWAILPYFTNTTIDEPIPTSTTIKTSDGIFRASADNINRSLVSDNIPIGSNIITEEILKLASLLNDEPFQGEQVSPRLTK